MVKRDFRSVFATVATAMFVFVSCGVDVTGTATTVVPIGPTDFATIPPVVSTLPNTTTSLPPGAVGVEQEYIVQAGDSPNLVANLFGITLTELLSWNGLVAASQFPYAGRKLRIPPSAQVVSTNVQQTVSANVVGKPGCGTRPAGTYEVAQGDYLLSITKKFCVSMGALISANRWSSIDVLLYPGMKINIPAAGS